MADKVTPAARSQMMAAVRGKNTTPERTVRGALLKAAWKQLRSVKTALKAVSSGLNGYMPQNFTDIAYLSEPLEPRVGYGVDENFVGGWAEALAQLADDADVDLPLFG
jgi:hypothetical protein